MFDQLNGLTGIRSNFFLQILIILKNKFRTR